MTDPIERACKDIEAILALKPVEGKKKGAVLQYCHEYAEEALTALRSLQDTHVVIDRRELEGMRKTIRPYNDENYFGATEEEARNSNKGREAWNDLINTLLERGRG